MEIFDPFFGHHLGLLDLLELQGFESGLNERILGFVVDYDTTQKE
jgi:hypothetical protein